MKLALSIISEGDHPHLKRAVKSVYKYVDHIFITTTKINKPQWEDPKITWTFRPWDDDFAAARNFNLQTIPGSFTYMLWMDSDDVIKHPELVKEVALGMDAKGLDAVFVDYNYRIDKQGNALIVHPRERIVRLGLYKWKSDLHETLIPNRKVRTIHIKDFTVDHYPTKENETDGILRNLRILQKSYDKQRKALVKGDSTEIDPRTEYYLARCLYDTHAETGYKRAFQLFQDYLEHSGWDEERAFAWNYLGNIQYIFKKFEESTVSYLSAIKERPEFPTWHINLARSYSALKDFGKAEHHIKVAMNMDQPNTAMILTPTEDKINSLVVLFYVYFNKKDFPQTLKAANMLYELQPTEENARRIESVESLQKWTHWMQNVSEMTQDMYAKGEIDKIESLLKGLPDDVINTVMADTLRTQYTRPKVWPKNSICYYAAIDVHTWSPKSLKTGLGGSEQAIINLSKQWVKMGYKVTVYTNVGEDEGVFDGVEYKNFYRFNEKERFDIVVSWRNTHFIEKTLLDARLILLDLHDVPEVEAYDKELLQKIDYIMVKSDYHKSLLSNVPESKFKVVGNGINWSFLNSINAIKRPHAVFYGSSPDRGLESLLDIWPEVIKAVPDATLDVCYGFELFLKLRGHVKMYKDWYMRMMEKLKQPGITHHGKVGEKELYEIAKSCSIWAYPTQFQEIDCITARYCQAVGTMPLVYDYAALTTSVQRGVRLSVDPFEASSLFTYRDALIKGLKEGIPIVDCVENAKQFDWKIVAKEWVKVFEEPKKEDIKVTVFTPTIRSGFWNLQAENLSKQTYKNFEWLIIDDYPTDRKELADKYAKKYNLNIRYMRGKKDRNIRKYALTQANNTAIFQSSGELLVWLQDFILLPYHTVERMVEIYRRHPNDLIAPVDIYHHMSVKPNMENKEDWFDGNTEVIGKIQRKNVRLKLGEMRYSLNPYDFELNVGAAPIKLLRKLNGFWEFMDDGLGYDNTEIAIRALKIGSRIIIDERTIARPLDLWEWLAGKDENIARREWAINPPRYIFLKALTDQGILPLVRDRNIDDRIKLHFDLPGNMNEEEATVWINKNAKKIALKWMKEYIT